MKKVKVGHHCSERLPGRDQSLLDVGRRVEIPALLPVTPILQVLGTRQSHDNHMANPWPMGVNDNADEYVLFEGRPGNTEVQNQRFSFLPSDCTGSYHMHKKK